MKSSKDVDYDKFIDLLARLIATYAELVGYLILYHKVTEVDNEIKKILEEIKTCSSTS